jgi:hypothetical protein
MSVVSSCIWHPGNACCSRVAQIKSAQQSQTHASDIPPAKQAKHLCCLRLAGLHLQELNFANSAGLWRPAHSFPLRPLEAAAVQQQLKAWDVHLLQSQLSLSLSDALAALLLAFGDLEGAHVQVACCADNGGPAKQWAIVFGQHQVSVTNLTSTAQWHATLNAVQHPSHVVQ